MSTISAVGGASSAWSDYSSSRVGAMKEKMFAKVDKDGSGGVDKTELQGMLDDIAKKSGTSAGSADQLLGKMDSDGNGSLSQSELEAGMKSLMPAPSSTVDFAQQRTGGDTSATDKLFSKLDTDGSGGLNASELNTLIDKIAAKTSSNGASSSAYASAWWPWGRALTRSTRRDAYCRILRTRSAPQRRAWPARGEQLAPKGINGLEAQRC